MRSIKTLITNIIHIQIFYINYIILYNKMQKYTFIHPTKCGGTAVEQYFQNNYSNIITGSGHKNVCTAINNPIIIIRDPIDRFISMYNYWKNGSTNGLYIRDNNFIKKYGNYTIKDYIKLLKTNAVRDLNHKFTWRQHYAAQTSWIKKDYYKNAIVIKYDENLDTKIHELLNYLNITDKNIILNKVNVTKKDEVILDNDDINFIKNRYNSDFELINNINNKPELFKKVI